MDMSDENVITTLASLDAYKAALCEMDDAPEAQRIHAWREKAHYYRSLACCVGSQSLCSMMLQFADEADALADEIALNVEHSRIVRVRIV
jgi:hypothetical protein